MALFVVFALAIAPVTTACSNGNQAVPLFFAAASLADVLGEAAEVYETETGNAVEFSFGGSIVLANQIARSSAPADGVIMAGDAPIELLVERGLVNRSDISVVSRNSLVVVSENDSQLQSLGDLVASDSRIAIADPQFAPAGQYAREALISAAVWDELEGQIIPTLDVRAALAAASSGSAEFAIVYTTDALTEPGLKIILLVDDELHQPVVYPAGAIAGSASAEAADAFVQFLLSLSGQQIFERHGFTGI